MTEYLAQPHPAQQQVDDLRDQFNGANGNGIRRKLNALLKEYPDLMDAYNTRYDILEEEDHLVAQNKEGKRAYNALIEHIFPDGLPELMPWAWLDNRPILRALSNYGDVCWSQNREEAIRIFTKMLQMNPTDNQGIRFKLLGILEGMAWTPFHKKFEKEDMYQWFEENTGKYEVFTPYLD